MKYTSKYLENLELMLSPFEAIHWKKIRCFYKRPTNDTKEEIKLNKNNQP